MTQPAGPPGIRVLVVDDSVDHRTLMARCLERAGMKVDAVASAAAALAMLEEHRLVLLDYRLAADDGLDVLEQIRARPEAPSVIMVTGAGSTRVAVDAMRAGAVDYVAKEHGYLDALPSVVERAWRHDDLLRRAHEVQRLALLVTSTTDRDGLFREIVAGARRLLHAEACALLVDEDGRRAPVEVLGLIEDLEDLATGPPIDRPRIAADRLVVPLPHESGMAAGALVLARGELPFTEDELRLGQVFASFAGIALANLRQFELERQLVTELQQTLDARRDFVASVSHELRTPLTSIAGFAETLRARDGDLDDAQRADLLDRISGNTDSLTELVDDLLQLASLERDTATVPRIDRVPLSEHVERTLAELAHITRDRHVRVAVPDVDVMADASLLRRVLANLVGNAVKFSADGTAIEIAGQLDGGSVRISVTDRGVGLSELDAARVFDPFFRARSAVINAVRGTGIGLALVREYVGSMNGEVAVRSVPGQGSTFSFTLPRAGDGDDELRPAGHQSELA